MNLKIADSEGIIDIYNENEEIKTVNEISKDTGIKNYMNLKIADSEGIIDIYNENEEIKTVNEISKDTG